MPQELGISDHEWVNLAESLLLSRELATLLPYGELGYIHQMRVAYLEEYFGLRPPPQIQFESVVTTLQNDSDNG